MKNILVLENCLFIISVDNVKPDLHKDTPASSKFYAW